MDFDLDKQKDGSVTIDVTANTSDVADVKADALTKLGQHVEIKGFRKGKAPAKMVGKRVKTEVLVEEILNLLINRAYLRAIQDHKINPIADPTIIFPDLKDKPPETQAHEVLWPKMEKEGLKFSIKTFVEPEFELGDWKKAIRGIEGDDLTEKIFDTLAEEVKIEIPEELVEREVNHRLYHQAQAVAQTGMSLEDYLKSQGDNLDDYREKLSIGAENRLKVKFILPKIAEELDVKLEKEEDFEYTIEKLKEIAQSS